MNSELNKLEAKVSDLTEKLNKAKLAVNEKESELRLSVTVEKQTRGKDIFILTTKEGLRYKAKFEQGIRGRLFRIRREINGKFENKPTLGANTMNDARLRVAFLSSE